MLLFVVSPVSEWKAPSEIPMCVVNWVIKYIDIHLQTNTSDAFIVKLGIANLDGVVNLENISCISRLVIEYKRYNTNRKFVH